MSSQRVSVESACIACSIETIVLQLEFRNGLDYKYFSVPGALYTDLLSAESKVRVPRGRDHRSHGKLIGHSTGS